MSASAKSKETKTAKTAKNTKSVKTSAKESEEKVKRPRREVSKESVTNDGVALVTRIEAEIETLRSSKDKVKGIKLLRTLGKLVKQLNKDVIRVLKIKKKRVVGVDSENKSGFNKLVQISPELTAFTGWPAGTPQSRVQVTRFICAYIKEHDLQKPEDKRKILPDEKLTKLLRYDKTGEPLTYFLIQRLIQPHFIKEPKVDKKVVKKDAPAAAPSEEPKEKTIKSAKKEEKKAAPAPKKGAKKA